MRGSRKRELGGPCFISFHIDEIIGVQQRVAEGAPNFELVGGLAELSQFAQGFQALARLWVAGQASISGLEQPANPRRGIRARRLAEKSFRPDPGLLVKKWIVHEGERLR